MHQPKFILGLERFHAHLKLTHTSQTEPRDQIFLAFNSYGPLTKHQLINRSQLKISPATIYRSLLVFQDLEIIEEVHPGLFQLTDRFHQHHHYFWCRICGAKTAFNDRALEQSLTRIANHRNLTMENHQVELSGIYSICAQSSETAARPSIGDKLRRPLGF